MSVAFLAQAEGKLNMGVSEQSIPSGDIVGSLCGSTNQRFAVTCEGDFPFPFQVPKIYYIWKEGTGTSMQEIEFYCRKCRKSMKISYELTGDVNTPVLAGITIRCHTNKCTRVVMLKKYTEGQIMAQADATYNWFSSDVSNHITKTIKLGLHDMGAGCSTE